MELFRTMVEENGSEVFESRSQMKAEADPPAIPRLGAIRVPTTVLAGGRDNPVQAVFIKRIVEGIPGARLVTVPDADHLINLSRPAAFDRELRAALGTPS